MIKQKRDGFEAIVVPLRDCFDNQLRGKELEIANALNEWSQKNPTKRVVRWETSTYRPSFLSLPFANVLIHYQYEYVSA